jgi:hypothetical protein
MAVHKSNLDLCHHHAMFEYLTTYQASAFFLVIVLFGFAGSAAAGAAAGFFEALRFNLSFIDFLFLELP